MNETTSIVVCGVSGCGKTTVGKALAARLGRVFYDADDFHPSANVEKMSRGEALTDDDRWPWLDALSDLLAREQGVVLACSALRWTYRDRLRDAGDVWFAMLQIDESELEKRMRGREHFMPAALLQSQLETLEVLEADEPGVVVVGGGVERMVEEVLVGLGIDEAPRR